VGGGGGGDGNSLAVTNGGRVGIGTLSPGYTLDVNGSFKATSALFTTNQVQITGYNTENGWNGTSRYGMGHMWNGTNRTYYNHSGGFNPQIGLKVTKGIWSQYNLFASSDIRIKENIRDVSDNLSLQQLRELPCVNYEYKDKIARGDGYTTGFIAQDVKRIMPNAVSFQKKIIPNEMRDINPRWTTLTDVSGNETYKLTIDDLQDVGGVKYKFYVSNDISGNDISGNEVMKEVVGNQDNTFTFEEKWFNVFMYGKEVDDFHIIDKQKIFAVAFSATQEIDRIQQAEKTKLAAAETKLTAAEAEIATLKTTLTDVLARLAALELN